MCIGVVHFNSLYMLIDKIEKAGLHSNVKIYLKATKKYFKKSGFERLRVVFLGVFDRFASTQRGNFVNLNPSK